MYYACNGSTCSGTSVPLSNQVQNPVALLPQDNNGIVVQLPSVPQGGAPSVSGSLVLGIGTESNNAPSLVTTYPLDQYGEFFTMSPFNSRPYYSFIDTGSNGYLFPFIGPASKLQRRLRLVLPFVINESLFHYCGSLWFTERHSFIPNWQLR